MSSPVNREPAPAARPLSIARLMQILNGSPVLEAEHTSFLLSLDEALHDAVVERLTERSQRATDRRLKQTRNERSPKHAHQPE